MQTLANFYDGADLADGFGSTAGDRANAHRGLDIPHALGEPVPALAAGVVISSSWNSALGNIVEVRQDDGRFVGYRHLRTAAPRVSAGQRVAAGDYIGQVSDTGSAANGYHLCTTNATGPGGVLGSPALVVDPWPWIQHYAMGKPRPGGTPTDTAGAPWEPSGDLAKRVQRALAGKDRYAGPADGVFGPATRRGVQLTLNASGRFGGITVPNGSQQSELDGELGRGAAWGIQEYGRDFGDYAGPQDGDPRAASWAAFALGLERP